MKHRSKKYRCAWQLQLNRFRHNLVLFSVAISYRNISLPSKNTIYLVLMDKKLDHVDANGLANKDQDNGGSTDSKSEEDYHNENKNKCQSVKEVTNVQLMVRKPKFDFAALKRKSHLMAKLPNFLAEMDAANRELEAEKASGTLRARRLEIDDKDDLKVGQYIEMNLGLGVLEEKTSDSDTSSEGELSDDKGVMDKLMGAEKDYKDEGEKKKIVIEEL